MKKLACAPRGKVQIGRRSNAAEELRFFFPLKSGNLCRFGLWGRGVRVRARVRVLIVRICAVFRSSWIDLFGESLSCTRVVADVGLSTEVSEKNCVFVGGGEGGKWGLL